MKDIEQFLRENAPETPDEGQFLIETNARLNAVEGIKKTVDTEHRRWRLALVIALAAGLVLGCVVTALVLLYPVQPTAGEDPVLVKAIQALHEKKEIMFGFSAFCATALGLLSLTRKRQVF